MPTKQIYTGAASREVILKGVNVIATVVCSTLGPKGKNVLINKSITKDGWNTAKAIELSESDEAIGANVIKEVAAKIVKEAGDNTTTGTLLAQQIITEGFKLLAAGFNGQDLKRGIDKAVLVIVDKIKSMAEPISIDSPKLKSIAYISGNNDEEIGNMVADAFVKTGKDGVIQLEHSNTGESYLEVVDGMQFERGYLSQLFINNQADLTCEFKNPLILLCEEKITSQKEIEHLLPMIATEINKNGQIGGVLIIAEDVTDYALWTTYTNKHKGYPICIVKNPGFGDNKKQVLEDIATIIGANVINVENGLRADTVKITDLGRADKVVISKDTTRIVNGSGKKHDINERIGVIRKSIELCTPEQHYEKKQLEERLAKLTGGVGVIYVGAATEPELKEKFDRFEDAHKATGASLSEGVVVGGGITLIRCKDALEELKGTNADEQAGIDLMKKVLYAPFKQMAKNADLELMVKEVCGKEQNFGYNFKTDIFENLFDAGVIDPAKVVRVAVVHSASVSGTLLTTDSVIINVDDELPTMLKR